MVLIHALVRPYVSSVHNIFDGIILQLIVIVTALPLVEFVDDYSKTLVVVITYLLIISPLAAFIAIKFWPNRNNIKIAFNYWTRRCLFNYSSVPNDKQPNGTNEVSIIAIMMT